MPKDDEYPEELDLSTKIYYDIASNNERGTYVEGIDWILL